MLGDVVANHSAWFAHGRQRLEVDGVTLFLGPADATIAFPPPGGDPAGAVAHAVGAGVREIGCWALAPDAELGRLLLELGFQDGWQPHWMGAETGAAGGSLAEESRECDAALPYASPGHRAVLGSAGVHHFVARDGGRLAGHAVLNVAGTTGGVYDMGVDPELRRRGHGLALTRAVLGRAAELGCPSVTLNATGEGEPMYRRAGFRSLGLGMSWWMFPHQNP